MGFHYYSSGFPNVSPFLVFCEECFGSISCKTHAMEMVALTDFMMMIILLISCAYALGTYLIIWNAKLLARLLQCSSVPLSVPNQFGSFSKPKCGCPLRWSIVQHAFSLLDAFFFQQFFHSKIRRHLVQSKVTCTVMYLRKIQVLKSSVICWSMIFMQFVLY